MSRSLYKLKELNFDPIEQLVKQYNQLMLDDEYMYKIMKGEIVELTRTGKEKDYSYIRHQMIKDKLVTISEKLLKYGYSPMSDESSERDITPLVINLTSDVDQFLKIQELSHNYESD